MLTIISITAVMLLIAATIAYGIGLRLLGLTLQFLTFLALVVLMATWFTQLGDAGWDKLDMWPILGAVALGAIVLLVPPYLGEVIEDF